jgi:hypothetical protein
MSESLVGRTAVGAINRFVLRLVGLAVIVAVVCFVTGRNAAALGVLTCPLIIGGVANHFKKAVRLRTTAIAPPAGSWILMLVGIMPGIILISVGLLIGGDSTVFVATAMGSSLIALSALMLTLMRSLRSQ